MKNTNQEKAKKLLQHYFRVCAAGAWDMQADNVAEIADIVDYIVAAAVDRIDEMGIDWSDVRADYE